MFIFVSYLSCALIVITSGLENGETCLTPNGENATCKPIDDCPVIKKALAYLNEDAVQFAKKSQCGYNGGPLVCCGSTGHTTTVAPPVEKTTVNQFIIQELQPATPLDNNLLPDLTLCGLQLNKSKQKNGQSERGEHPWLVSLAHIRDSDGLEEHVCSGALISKEYIVTSAECAIREGYTLKSARLGLWRLSARDGVRRADFPEKSVHPIEIEISEKSAHPYYSAKRGNNNIALLRLKQEVDFNDIIRPICLPPNDFPAPVPRTEMEISSWNLKGSPSDVKEKNTIIFLGFDECDKRIGNYTRLYFPGRVCVQGASGSPICDDESGTPVITPYNYQIPTVEDKEEQWYLEGIASKGFACDESGRTGLYMRISRYVTWILNNMHV